METSDPRVDRTRRKVLAATLELIHDEGWDGLSQAHVATRAGVGRATVYRHWPDLTDLLSEALTTAELDEHSAPTGDLRDDLVDELRAFARAMSTKRYGKIMTALIDRAEWDPNLLAVRRRVTAAGTSVLRTIISDAKRAGQLRSGADEQLLIAQLVGPISYRRFHSGQAVTKKFVAQIVDHALSAHALMDAGVRSVEHSEAPN